MYYINYVKINGFWSDKVVEINFNKDINFLIGVNGSGKTTFINLVAAALKVDFITLDRLQYDKIHVRLRSLNNLKFQPYIEIEKIRSETTPYPKIVLRIKSLSKEKPKEYILNEIEEENLFRYRSDITNTIRRLNRRQVYTEDINSQISALININWLSIHRVNNRNKEDSYESSVDQKIRELSTSFLSYFSVLQRKAAEETESFQKSIFLSLLTDESEEEIFKVLDNVNVNDEKKSLRDIFSEFKLPERMFAKKLDKHFESYEKSLNKVSDRDSPFTINDLSFLISTRRIHGVVQKWGQLVAKQKDIYQYRDTFLEVVNSLLQRKKLIITDRNELKIETDSGKKFDLQYLSSGEKQLIIILGECLLQQSAPYVYIADEPELSLHVLWQEKLVSSLKAINPNSQIIFATHSPDIVSSYGNCVIEIEKDIIPSI